MKLIPISILWIIRAILLGINLYLGAFLLVFTVAVVKIEELSERLEGKRRFKKNPSYF